MEVDTSENEWVVGEVRASDADLGAPVLLPAMCGSITLTSCGRLIVSINRNGDVVLHNNQTALEDASKAFWEAVKNTRPAHWERDIIIHRYKLDVELEGLVRLVADNEELQAKVEVLTVERNMWMKRSRKLEAANITAKRRKAGKRRGR